MKAAKRLLSTAALLSLVLLVGCGGGGGDSDSPDTEHPTSGGQSGGNPVGDTNRAPRISGQPASNVSPSQTYTFQPSASDPDGDSLTFSAANLPQWLKLNPSSGRLSGTPTAADIGTYSDIVITVSDGEASASLPAFSITVTDAATGTATLSWSPPTQNEDGSPLTDLRGYEIRYGQDPSSLSTTISLSNPSLSIYVVENLSSGTWYFAVAAVNSEGVTSSLSNVVSKTIS